MMTQHIPEAPGNGLLTISPNPADAFIEFQLPEPGTSYQVSLFDVSGQLMQSAFIEEGNKRMSTAELAEGVYLLQITNAAERMTTSIVVLH